MTPLHRIGDLIRAVLQAIPLPAVRVLFVVSLGLLLVWVLTLPGSEVTPAGGARRYDENLRIGASLALLVQIVIYCLL